LNYTTDFVILYSDKR